MEEAAALRAAEGRFGRDRGSALGSSAVWNSSSFSAACALFLAREHAGASESRVAGRPRNRPGSLQAGQVVVFEPLLLVLQMPGHLSQR